MVSQAERLLNLTRQVVYLEYIMSKSERIFILERNFQFLHEAWEESIRKLEKISEEVLAMQNIVKNKSLQNSVSKMDSEIMEVKSKLNSLENKFIGCNLQVEKTAEIMSRMKKRNPYTKASDREKNIVIHGLILNAGIELEVQVRQFFTQVFGFDSKVNRVKLLRNNPEKNSTTILVELYSIQEKKRIFKNCHRLKGQGLKVSIVDDLTPLERIKNKKHFENKKRIHFSTVDAVVQDAELSNEEMVVIEIEQDNEACQGQPVSRQRNTIIPSQTTTSINSEQEEDFNNNILQVFKQSKQVENICSEAIIKLVNYNVNITGTILSEVSMLKQKRMQNSHDCTCKNKEMSMFFSVASNLAVTKLEIESIVNLLHESNANLKEFWWDKNFGRAVGCCFCVFTSIEEILLSKYYAYEED